MQREEGGVERKKEKRLRKGMEWNPVIQYQVFLPTTNTKKMCKKLRKSIIPVISYSNGRVIFRNEVPSSKLDIMIQRSIQKANR